MDFEPSVGAEIQKRRPAVIVTRAEAGVLPLRVVVPFTDRSAAHSRFPWLVAIAPDGTKGLVKESSADTFQLKSLDTSRFVRQLGRLAEDDLERIDAAMAYVLGLA